MKWVAVVLISALTAYAVSSSSHLLGATILTTNSSDTLDTGRTNTNTSLTNLNTQLVSVAASVVSTSSPLSQGQVLYATGLNTMASVATTSVSAGTGLTGSFTAIGSSGSIALTTPVVISNGGTGTTTSRYGGIFFGDGSVFRQASTTALLNYDPTLRLFTTLNASTTQLSVASEAFYVNSAGRITAKDTTNNWSGVLSPTRTLVLITGTTSTWTASTTGSAYSPHTVAPFNGTIRQARCVPKIGATDGSFLGVNITVAGSNVTPSYFIASSTVGKITFSAGNTFTAGQIIQMNVGTTSTATATSISCSLDVTETP